jgi:hypothetical protein
MARMPRRPPDRLVEEESRDAAVGHPCPTLKAFGDHEFRHRSVRTGREMELQARFVERAAPEAMTVESDLHGALNHGGRLGAGAH